MPAPSSAAQAIALNAKYGPNAGLAIQRSQYLADALQRLEASGSDIRTPTALWSSLLADGITQWSKDRADKAAYGAVAADQSAQDAKLLKNTPLDTSGASAAPVAASPPVIASPTPPPPPADPNAVTSTPLPPAPPAGAPAASATPPAPAAASADSLPTGKALIAALNGDAPSTAPNPNDLDAVTRMIIGEAGGEGPVGQAAAGAVAYNRLSKGWGGAHSLSDVVYQPNQFEGITSPRATGADVNSPEYQRAQRIALGLADGSIPDPTGGATNFLNPKLQVADGRAIPAWATGQGQPIGNHVFYGGNPQGVASDAQTQASAAAASHQLPPGVFAGGGDPQNPSASPMPAAFGNVNYTPPGQGPQPYQVAANGPTPPPPSSAVGQPPPASPVTPSPVGAAPAAPPSPGPNAAGAMPGQIPHQMVTTDEWSTAASLLHDPRTRDLGVQELLKLKFRAASALDAPKNMMWDPSSGRAVPIPGTETTQLQGVTPSDAAQRDAFGAISHSAIPGKQGAVPEGKMWDQASQSYVPIPGGQVTPMSAADRSRWGIPTNDPNAYGLGVDGKPQVIAAAQMRPLGPNERAQWGISPQDRNSYGIGASGKPEVIANAPYNVKDVADLMKDLTGSQQYDKATKLTEMYRGAVQAAQRSGGISDAELKDNAAQIFSGGVARQFNSKMIDEGQGPWLRLKQIVPELGSGQKISPQGRQAILQAMHDYVGESQGAFNSLAASKSAFAAQQGVDLSPFISPLMRGVPDVPNLNAIPNGSGGYPSGGPGGDQAAQQAAVLAEAQRAIASGRDRNGVIARVKAMGIDPRGL